MLASRVLASPIARARSARLGLLALAVAGLGFGGCAQQPREVVASHGREYFPSSVYGSASRRVVADGQPIPRGGGQYLVGKPYTIAGRTYYPSESRQTQVGNASWYGDAFHGRLTANGEVYDRDGFTAASPTMPLPSYARVTNLRNNYSMIVRVNDRGPYASNRIMDVSRRVAESLDFKRYGTAKIKVEYVGRASLAGSEDARLFATLRTNGTPAVGQIEPTMVAEAPPRARVASIAPYAPPQREPEEAYVPRRRAPVYAEETYAPRRPSGYSEERIERPYAGYEEHRASRRHAAVEDEEMPSRHVRERFRDEDTRRVAAAPMPRPGERYLPASPRGERYLPASPRPTFARHFEDVPPARTMRVAARTPMPPQRGMLPPSRPMDLGTIPGAGSQIHARHETARLKMARARDD